MSGSGFEIEALVGTTVGGKYRIDAVLGRGGMGAVFRATNTAIGKQVALKFLYRESARDLDAVTRFQREAEAASAAESAHIVQIFDSGRTEDDLPFLVMELLKGEDLRTRLKREGRLQLPEVIHIAGQVARALRSAHAAGIVHRDLKPDNVFLCARDDDPMFVKIVDFGISKVSRKSASADTLTHRGVVLGTASYMSPEQAQAKRDIDGRADLFSLGAIMYEALAGRPPHAGSSYESVLIDICTRDAPDIRTYAPDVTEPVARVLEQALARDRERRFPTAADMYDALAAAAPGMLRAGGPSKKRDPDEPSPMPTPTGDSRSRAGDARGSQTDSESSEPPFRTAEGTALQSAERATRAPQVRRMLLVALAAALGAFALSALLMQRGRPPPPDTSAPWTTQGVPAAAAPSAVADGWQREEPIPSPESSSSAQAQAPAPAASQAAGSEQDQPPSSARKRTHRRIVPKPSTSARPAIRSESGRKPVSPDSRPGRLDSDSTGVAKGLKLVTEP